MELYLRSYLYFYSVQRDIYRYFIAVYTVFPKINHIEPVKEFTTTLSPLQFANFSMSV
jgi:hypothetical protein